jgi:hypothetical protein
LISGLTEFSFLLRVSKTASGENGQNNGGLVREVNVILSFKIREAFEGAMTLSLRSRAA